MLTNSGARNNRKRKRKRLQIHLTPNTQSSAPYKPENKRQKQKHQIKPENKTRQDKITSLPAPFQTKDSVQVVPVQDLAVVPILCCCCYCWGLLTTLASRLALRSFLRDCLHDQPCRLHVPAKECHSWHGCCRLASRFPSAGARPC